MKKSILDWNSQRLEPTSSTTESWKPAPTILGGASIEISPNPNTELAAAGDLPCRGYCAEGGTRGTTGAYVNSGRPVCRDCVVKLLGIGDEPSSEQNRILRPFELKPK